MSLEKNNNLILCFDQYYRLLTDRQAEIFRMYYFEDFSLSEIGDNLSITRQAVKSALDSSCEYLLYLESIFSIVETRSKLYKYLDSVDIDSSIKGHIKSLLEGN